MTSIPEDYTAFFHWVKERTELFWSIDPKTSKNEFVCDEWIYGAKWIGLTDEQIDAVEKKYAITFMPEHRAFLRILHTIDRKEPIEYTETFEEDAEVLIEYEPFFYNWLEDDKAILDKLDWPFRTVFGDVIGANQVWLESWGERPDDEESVRKIFTDWFSKAPKLIPLTSHRFLISDAQLEQRPVLSMWGSDIIVYGWNLRGHLLSSLREHLNILQMVYDEEYKEYVADVIDEVAEILKKDYAFDENKTIPYWKEMILIWSTGWSSFGMEYPYENEGKGQPIVKTYSPGKTAGEQKRFNDFSN